MKTLQFQGQFQRQSVLILVDSGSSTSFISQQLLLQLSVEPIQCPSLAVRVANGVKLAGSRRPNSGVSLQNLRCILIEVLVRYRKDNTELISCPLPLPAEQIYKLRFTLLGFEPVGRWSGL